MSVAHRLVAAALSLLGLLLVSTPAVRATPLTVAYAAVPDYVALYLAKERGLFEQRGLDVTLQQMGNSAVIPPALVSGSVQIAGIPDAVFMQAVAGGLDLKMFAGVGFTPKEVRNGSIIVRNGLTLKSAADLVGHKVGVSGIGSFFQILLIRWLQDGKVDPAKVGFVETPFLQMSDLLKSGQVDAVAVGQPFVNRMVSAGIGYEMAPYISQLGRDIPIGGFAAEGAWAAKNTATIAAFKAALHQAIELLRADPSLVQPMLVKYLKMTPETLRDVPLNRIDDAIEPAYLDFWQDLMFDQKLIPSRAATDSFILR